MLFLILLSLNNSTVENTYTYGGELTVQQNLVALVQVLEYDFRKIAYCAEWRNFPDPTQAILVADSNRITFLTDISSDGIMDTMKYYIGSPSELSHTANPRDRILYRVINSEAPVGTNLGVTQFRLIYFDSFEDTLHFPITIPSQVHSMEINLAVENPAAYDEKYSSVFWRQVRLASRNLDNR
ncbi:MAG: hypothetical protein V1720_05975 [bacterium]